MAVAEAWLGGIGKYPPYPSRLGNTPLVPRLPLSCVVMAEKMKKGKIIRNTDLI